MFVCAVVYSYWLQHEFLPSLEFSRIIALLRAITKRIDIGPIYILFIRIDVFMHLAFSL